MFIDYTELETELIMEQYCDLLDFEAFLAEEESSNKWHEMLQKESN